MGTHGNEDGDVMENRQLHQRIREDEQGPSSRTQQLEAIFEAITDGIFVYDKDGQILQMNQAARHLLGSGPQHGYPALSLEERGTMITQRYVQGKSLPLAQWATTRVLNGEVLTGTAAVEFIIRGLHERDLHINLSGAPIYDQERDIVGAIIICRDVTERRKLEQRTQDALHALLTMAEALVQLPQSAGEIDAWTGEFELVSGVRMMTSYICPGGLQADIPRGLDTRVRAFINLFPQRLQEYHDLLTNNQLWLERTKGIGVLSAQDAIAYGASGPVLRGSGVVWDIRKAFPYSGYEQFNFDIPVGSNGDVYDRYLVRMLEMEQSLHIVEQALEGMPAGSYRVSNPKVAPPPKTAG